jgi:hypothetical protein
MHVWLKARLTVCVHVLRVGSYVPSLQGRPHGVWGLGGGGVHKWVADTNYVYLEARTKVGLGVCERGGGRPHGVCVLRVELRPKLHRCSHIGNAKGGRHRLCGGSGGGGECTRGPLTGTMSTWRHAPRWVEFVWVGGGWGGG